MTGDELRALQAPLKAQYKENPATAQVTIRIVGQLDPANVACDVQSPRGSIHAGLHRAAGGDGSDACAGDMLLESLAGCAGVTLRAVATAMNIPLRSGTVTVEGDMDFRGTLGVNREIPVGFTAIRVKFQVDTDAPPEQVDKLIQLAERYCVVFQTLKSPPPITVSRR